MTRIGRNDKKLKTTFQKHTYYDTHKHHFMIHIPHYTHTHTTLQTHTRNFWITLDTLYTQDLDTQQSLKFWILFFALS